MTGITPAGCANEIRRLLEALREADLLLNSNNTWQSSELVTWTRRDGSAGMLAFVPGRIPTANDYLLWVAEGMYTAALVDGALLQLTYTFRRGDVTGHRLAYVPCPVEVPRELLQQLSIEEAVEFSKPASLGGIPARTVVRIDYDPVAAAPGHPSTHLTLNGPNCRIPVYAPVSAARFIHFVLTHFYGGTCTAVVPDSGVAIANIHKVSTIEPDEAAALHFRWIDRMETRSG